MDIAAVSSALSAVSSATSGSLMELVSVKMLDQSMELTETMNAQLVHAMEQSVTPHLGGNIDIRIYCFIIQSLHV